MLSTSASIALGLAFVVVGGINVWLVLEALARVQHPNVVQIYEVGEHEGRPFLCLEFVDGGSLSHQIIGDPQPERTAAQLLETLARAVQHTHQRGILHRDLNPNNVLLTADGTPKITDFGLAKLVDAEAVMTQTQAFLGTPHYMAPEQAAGHAREVGPAADVYSLGAILYEMLTGQAPFGGDTILETLEQVRTAEPAPPSRAWPDLSPDLETICLKCLEKAPERRYATAEALADDLHRFLEGRPILARSVSSWRRLARSARRHPRLAAAALTAVLLAGLLLTGGLYYRAKTQLSERRAEDHYQRFVQKRNEAHFYGLLTGDQESLFVGGGDNRAAAESAARDALTLAGIDVASGETRPADLPAQRKEEVAGDCYALLLVLAGLREFPAGAEPERRRQYQEALRLLDRANQFGLQTRAYHLCRAAFLQRLGEREAAKEE